MPQFGDTGAAGAGGNNYGGGGGYNDGQGNNGRDASDRAKDKADAKAIADRVTANKAKQAREKQAAADKAKAKTVADKRASDKASYDKAQAAKAQAKAVAQAKAKRDAQAKIAKAEKAQALKVKQAKDKADAKALADKRAKDKTEYEKGLALAAKKAKVKRDNAAKAKTIADRVEANKIKQAKEKVKADALKAAEKGDIPVGAAWSGNPNETNVDPLERMPTNDGAGMSGAGVAFYPAGKGKTLEDYAPDSISGYGRAVFNPLSSIITTAGQTMLNQAKYGMNEEAANLYKSFIADPSNAGKSVEELVQMARQPQMDRQQDNAYIGGQGGAGMSEKQLEMFRPRAISPDNWGGLTKGQKMALMGDASGDGGMSYESGGGFPNGGGGGGPASTGGNQGGGGGMLTGSVAPTEPQAPTLGQLTTGDYTPTERPSWAPSQSGYQAPPAPQSDFAPQWNQQPQQPAFAPQWSPQAQQPAWAPQPRSMLGAPMQLQAPPSRFLKR